jgi:hypothetical protein
MAPERPCTWHMWIGSHLYQTVLIGTMVYMQSMLLNEHGNHRQLFQWQISNAASTFSLVLAEESHAIGQAILY